MEDVDGRKSPVAHYELRDEMHRLGRERKVQRESLERMSDQMRDVALIMSRYGYSDAEIARTAQVSVTTLRAWFGKRY
jgi:DNA-directed RNA polymerase specialized sigma24 family protein